MGAAARLRSSASAASARRPALRGRGDSARPRWPPADLAAAAHGAATDLVVQGRATAAVGCDRGEAARRRRRARALGPGCRGAAGSGASPAAAAALAGACGGAMIGVSVAGRDEASLDSAVPAGRADSDELALAFCRSTGSRLTRDARRPAHWRGEGVARGAGGGGATAGAIVTDASATASGTGSTAASAGAASGSVRNDIGGDRRSPSNPQRARRCCR